ncbi:MAG: hypothetical protein WC501_02915 [Candidatus Micrarchaeia archaeon]
MTFEKFKTETKKEEKKQEEKKRIPEIRTIESENVEIKKLYLEDSEDAMKLLMLNGFEVTKKEVEHIVKDNLSFGAYVGRQLVGVGLGWAACFDIKKVIIVDGIPNSIYLEDVVLSLAFEGTGIRSMLLKSREQEGLIRKFQYSIAYISEDLPMGELEDYIKERGKKLTQMYMLEKYQFFETKHGILAVKVF